jgi:hypothetical protein
MISNLRFRTGYALVEYVAFEPISNVVGAAMSVAVAKVDILRLCCSSGCIESQSKNLDRITTHINCLFLLTGCVHVHLVTS